MADRFRLDGLAYHLIWSGSGPKTSGCKGGYPLNASYYIQRALNGRATIRLDGGECFRPPPLSWT